MAEHRRVAGWTPSGYVGKDSSGTRHVLVSELARPGFRLVEGSEGALMPFFSPDGEWIGFFTDNRVRKAPVGGGAAVTLATGRTPIYAEWVAEEDIFVGNSAPGRVSESFSWSYTSDVLPGGQTLLRTDASNLSTAVNQAAIGLLPRAGGEYRPLVGPGFGARALPGGFIYFALRGELHASRFDAERGVVGRSLPQVSNVAMDALMGQVHAAASDTGLLVFAEGGDLSAGRPVWMDRAGHVEELPLPAAQYNVFHLGPGDRKLALQTCDLEDYVLVADLEDGSSHRLGLSPAGWPTWSSDGSSLYVSSRDGDVVRLGRVDPRRDSFENLAGVQNAVTAFFTDVHPTSGALVDVWRSGTGGVNLLRPDSRELTELVGDGSWGGQFSPDGSLLAYVSYDTGAARIRVRTFPDGDVDVPV